MTIMRWQPMGNRNALRRDMDRFWCQFFGGDRDENQAPLMKTMALDVVQNENELIIKADLPGVSQKDVEITVEGDVLTIKAVKHQEERVEGTDYARMERSHGSFGRRLSLPSKIQVDKVSARLVDGVLTVTLPKADEDKPRKIDVN